MWNDALVTNSAISFTPQSTSRIIPPCHAQHFRKLMKDVTRKGAVRKAEYLLKGYLDE